MWLGHALDPRFEPLQRTDGSASSLQQETQSSQTWSGLGSGFRLVFSVRAIGLGMNIPR